MRLWQGRFGTTVRTGYTLVLPQTALETLELTPGQTGLLRFGHRSHPCWIQVTRRERRPGVAWVDRSLAAALPLPTGHRLWLRQDEDGGVRLGPVLGFLSLRSIYADQRSCPYAGDQRLFAEACRLAGRSGGLAYVFGPSDIDWATATTRGWTYRVTGLGEAGGRWVAGVFPLPDVIYNRILGRSRELSTPIREVEERLRGLPGTRGFFNPGYFDKWQVSDALAREGSASQYQPATARVTAKQLQEMLLSLGAVYIKPRAGFAGRGIMRVERLAPGRYRIIRIVGARPVGRVAGWPTVRRLVGLAVRREPAIIQQAIKLPTCRGRSFDLRVMVQKDERGLWRATAVVAKLASPGNITTHIRTGGEAQFAGPVLQEAFGPTGAAVHQGVEAAALATAAALERGLGQELGELGMDVAVDAGGHPWILEVNAKPGRKVFSLDAAWNRHWIEGLVYYGGYRAGFLQGDVFAGAAATATRAGMAAAGAGRAGSARGRPDSPALAGGDLI
ncbi:MAG: YheC/YheD family endospore coat-associated protein [Symbiobacteriia bacterium]